jgi:hypothetical protein
MFENELIGQMEKISSGETRHIYGGQCPNGMTGWRVRDPECPACQILTKFDVVAASMHIVKELEN